MYSSPSMVELATSQPGKSNMSVIHPLHTKIRILDYTTDKQLHTEIRRAEKRKAIPTTIKNAQKFCKNAEGWKMQRKATKKSPAANAEQRRFLAWVKEQPCAVCSNWPCIAHHCEGATWAHNKTKCGHWFILPLCQIHDDVVTHGSRRLFREEFGSQSALWLQLIEKSPIKPPQEVIDAIEDWNR